MSLPSHTIARVHCFCAWSKRTSFSLSFALETVFRRAMVFYDRSQLKENIIKFFSSMKTSLVDFLTDDDQTKECSRTARMPLTRYGLRYEPRQTIHRYSTAPMTGFILKLFTSRVLSSFVCEIRNIPPWFLIGGVILTTTVPVQVVLLQLLRITFLRYRANK